MELAPEIETTDEIEAPKQKTLRRIAWTFFAIFCLLFFVLIKIPQSKVNLTVISRINQQLEPMGYSLSADKGALGLLWGINYSMDGVKILKMANQRTLSFSRLRLSPSFFSLLQGKMGADILLEDGEGKLKGTVLMKNQNVEADLSLDALNLGRIGLIPFLTDFDGSAEVKGTLKYVQGTGAVKLDLSRIVFDEAKVQGFAIPKIQVSQGTVDADFDPKKLNLRSFQLGKQAATDDLNLTSTGDLKIAPMFDTSEVNAKVQLSLSQKLQTSFSLIDAFLGAMKQKDGSYKFKLQGPIMGAMPTPDT